MKASLLSTFFCLALFSVSAQSASDLVNKARQNNVQQTQVEQARVSEFKQQEQALRTQKAQLEAQRKALQAETDQLTEQFSTNEETLAKLEQQLQLETGSLGELFGVVRQNAKELQEEFRLSVNGGAETEHQQVIDDIVAAKALPSMNQLRGLWQSMLAQIQQSGEVASVTLPLVQGDGKKVQVQALRVGSFGLVSEQGYMRWKPEQQMMTPYLRQPENGPILAGLTGLASGETENMLIDPTHGVLLEQLAHSPTLQDRLESGGVVGKIILALFVIGLLIALIRGVTLLTTRQKIQRQLKQSHNPGDNPLGRILGVYDKDKHRTVEALELRLLEAVVDEQTHLEKGLSMLKLLAALAPMLGLLGTVTGMIETFQIITQFGNGDPKVMASGISMALITTVLGLIAAMPLLLAHSLLTSQVSVIRNILEKQGIGLVAAQAEKQSISSGALAEETA